MGRPTLANSRDTKAELVQAALKLLQTRGFNEFSYHDLSERLNIKTASIHYYFPAKEDLGVALMEFGQERFGSWVKSQEGKHGSATSEFKAYLAYYTKITEEGTQVCPGGAMLAEWNTLPERLKRAADTLALDHRTWLKGVLERGRKNGEFKKDDSLEHQYHFVYAAIQGAQQISRSHPNQDHFRTITQQILETLKS
jgi:TetR/AcrR family transcriptional repressor of nem operon